MWRRYARLFGANARADTDDELGFHFEMRVRDYMRAGLDEQAARAAARERIGDVEAVRRELVNEGERHALKQQRREWLQDLGQDVRYGARVLLRSPLFALVAVLTLALGIGATTAIYSVVYRVLLAPLPFADPARLVRVWETSPQGDERNVVSPGNYLDWAAQARSFSAIGAHRGVFGVALTGSGEPAQLLTTDLTPSAFRALGATPLLGRGFSPEDADGAGDVVLLSHALWRQRFGGARDVVNQRIVLDGQAYTIVGVMPASFEFPDASAQLWRPLTPDQFNPNERRSHNFMVIARLAPRVTAEQAQTEMSGLARTLAQQYPQFMEGWGVNVAPMHEDLTGDARPLLIVLLSAVAVVLLIACGNLANLLLAKAVTREREMALRGALGAGRARIARQLLTESVLIAVAGGLLGLLCARVALRFLVAAAPDNIPLLQQASLNWSVMAVAAGLTVLSTMLFGLAPALRLSRVDLQSALRSRRADGVRHARVRGALLIAEVALTVVLLVGAGLLVRSFLNVQRTNLGYRSADLAVLSLDLPHARYRDNAAHIAFYDRLLERLSSVPGVAAVSGVTTAPGTGESMTFSFAIDGRQAANPSGREDPEELLAVGKRYFRTIGVPLLAGRDFADRDRAESPPVVIISQSLARKHWQNESPIGKRISFRPGQTPWMEIIGVVGDVRMVSPDEEPVPALYVPHAQKTNAWLSWYSVVARVSARTDAQQLLPRMRAALWELDNQIPVQRFATVQELYGESMARRSFALVLVLGFALVALLLSVVGLYGLIAYTVAQQKQEIGVRMALGARQGEVIRGVLVRSLRLASAGVALGLVASLFATRLLTTLLYNVSANDPATLLVISALVTTIAAVAAGIPALRAVRTSPLTALRG